MRVWKWLLVNVVVFISWVGVSGRLQAALTRKGDSSSFDGIEPEEEERMSDVEAHRLLAGGRGYYPAKKPKKNKVKICRCNKRNKCKTKSVSEKSLLPHLRKGATIGRCGGPSLSWSQLVADNFSIVVEILFSVVDENGEILPSIEQAGEWFEQCWFTGILAGLIDREGVATLDDFDEFCTDREGIQAEIPEVVLGCNLTCWDLSLLDPVPSRRSLQAGTVANDIYRLCGDAVRSASSTISGVGASIRRNARAFGSVIVTGASNSPAGRLGRASAIAVTWAAARGQDVAFPIPPNDPCGAVGAICERMCFWEQAYSVTFGAYGGLVDSLASIGLSLEQLCASCDLANVAECNQLPTGKRPFPCGIAGGKECPILGPLDICLPPNACCYPFEKLCLSTGDCTLRVNCCPEDGPCCPKDECPNGTCEGEQCGGDTCPKQDGCCDGRTKCGTGLNENCIPDYNLCSDGTCPGTQCGGEDCPLENGCCPGQEFCNKGSSTSCVEVCCFSTDCGDPSAYRCEDDTCIDLNECENSSPCGLYTECTNTVGSFECRCSDGTIVGPGVDCDCEVDSANGIECCVFLDCPGIFNCVSFKCEDINECDYLECGLNAECENTEGSSRCVCSDGTEVYAFEDCCENPEDCGDPSAFTCDDHVCRDINECDDSPCGQNALCSNTDGSFECKCLDGTLVDPGVDCQEACEILDLCGLNADCENTDDGSFRCVCPDGTAVSVFEDCIIPPPDCGNGVCEGPLEDEFTCEQDCGSVCGGGRDCGNSCVPLGVCCSYEQECSDGTCERVGFCCFDEIYCDPPTFARPPVARGDPQIVTFFGFRYECNAEGIFILLKSNSSPFQIQGIFTSVDSDVSASVVTGIAMQDDGYPTVQVSIAKSVGSAAVDVNGCPLQIYIDGALQDTVTPGDLGAGLNVPDGNGRQIVVQAQGQWGSITYLEHRLSLAFGIDSTESFGCFLFGQRLNYPIAYGGSITPRPGYRFDEHVYGLFGSPYGGIFFTRDGEPYQPASTSPEDTYAYCTEQFCVTDETESLFTYEQGFIFSDFEKCNATFVPIDIMNVSDEITDLCGEDVSCLTDAAVGGIDAGRLTLEAQIIEDEEGALSSNLRFSPSVIPAFQSTSVTVTVELISLVTDLDDFVVYPMNPETLEQVAGEPFFLLPLTGSGVASDVIYSNQLTLEPSSIGQVYALRVIPRINGMEMPNSSLVQTSWSAIRSYAETQLTASPVTPGPVTPAPSNSPTSAPTKEPTPGPTTRAPTTSSPISSEPTAQPNPFPTLSFSPSSLPPVDTLPPTEEPTPGPTTRAPTTSAPISTAPIAGAAVACTLRDDLDFCTRPNEINLGSGLSGSECRTQCENAMSSAGCWVLDDNCYCREGGTAGFGGLGFPIAPGGVCTELTQEPVAGPTPEPTPSPSS